VWHAVIIAESALTAVVLLLVLVLVSVSLFVLVIIVLRAVVVVVVAVLRWWGQGQRMCHMTLLQREFTLLSTIS
jgi:hypothetical protein